MRRRKARIVKTPYKPCQKRIKSPATDSNSFSSSTRNQPRRFFFPSQFQTSAPSAGNKTATSLGKRPCGRLIALRLARPAVQLAVAGSSFLSLSASILSFSLLEFFATEEDKWPYGLYALLFTMTILQVPLILFYWRRSGKYWERSRVCLKLEKTQVHQLRNSRKALFQCFCECLFNLCVLIPETEVCVNRLAFGHEIRFCSQQFLLMLVVLRNYHFVRLLYWSSQFSDPRAKLYARLTTVLHSKGFIARCFFARHSYKLILGVYGLLVGALGLLSFLAESSGVPHTASDLWNDVWVQAYTGTTIGYGEHIPNSLFGFCVVVICCVAGSLTLGLLSSASNISLRLGLAESNVCSELILDKTRQKQLHPAVLVLQSWWRLMRMRSMRVLQAPVILNFYSLLGKFRGLLVARQRIRHGRFEYQIQSFESVVRRKVKSMSEYLMPIQSVEVTTHDIIREQFQIYQKMKQFKRISRVKKFLPPLRIDLLEEVLESTSHASPSSSSPRKGANTARAKIMAHRHLKARLLSEG